MSAMTYSKLKFIMATTQLEYSNGPTTLCAFICSSMGMLDTSTAMSWWEHWKNMIADVLNAKRDDVTGAIKKVFVCKYLHQVTTKIASRNWMSLILFTFVCCYCSRGNHDTTAM
jgi:hypothetical protein